MERFSKYCKTFPVTLFLGASLFVFLNSDVNAQFFSEDTTESGSADNFQGFSANKGSNTNLQIKSLSQKEKKETKVQEIKISLHNFNVEKTLSGIISCNADIVVHSTMEDKISNISFRLKWPQMETPLSFDNIEPGEAIYKRYALLGNGCYNMDRVPNIIVNRCRIKTMTQQQCATYIRWIK